MYKKDTNTKLDGISITILIVSLIVILFSFLSPFIFVQDSLSGLDFNETGQIGDTIGGLMNPFIAISGVFLTFLAFYIQFKANRLQRDLFRQELDSNKFENQFYEMLRLHKENVNEFSISLKSKYYSGKETVQYESVVAGRDVFRYFLHELKISYFVAKHIYPDREPEEWLNKAYHKFFHGLDLEKKRNSNSREGKLDYEYDVALAEIENGNFKGSTPFNDEISKYGLRIEWLKFDLFRGHSSLLAHYYRHLFQTVKFIVKQNEDFITYSEKRNYLRILRAQLSNHEQAMLFYNWKSGFGDSWENETNKFFTDYRMIHNIYNGLLIKDFNLNEIFKLSDKPYYMFEIDRENDSLFEFQDWE